MSTKSRPNTTKADLVDQLMAIGGRNYQWWGPLGKDRVKSTSRAYKEYAAVTERQLEDQIDAIASAAAVAIASPRPTARSPTPARAASPEGVPLRAQERAEAEESSDEEEDVWHETAGNQPPVVPQRIQRLQAAQRRAAAATPATAAVPSPRAASPPPSRRLARSAAAAPPPPQQPAAQPVQRSDSRGFFRSLISPRAQQTTSASAREIEQRGPQVAAAVAAARSLPPPDSSDDEGQSIAQAATDISQAARSLRGVAGKLERDRSLTAKEAKLVRRNAKRFPLLAREVAAERMPARKLAVESEGALISLGEEERELEDDAGEQEFTERRAAPVDTAEAIEVATHSIPGLVPGSRVWQRPRFADVSFV